MRRHAPASSFDVLILGGGAAGLAAAHALASAGRSVCVLEARERVGGRIFTVEDGALAVPIELGAEFVHGRPRITLEWIERTGGVLVDTPRSHWTLRRGTLRREDNSFAELHDWIERTPRPRTDVSFAEFLAGPARAWPPRVRELARRLVEGYDAADATRVSTHDTLAEWVDAGVPGAPSYRPLGGYGRLMQQLRRAAEKAGAEVRLRSVVREVRWVPGRVTAAGTARGRPFEAQAARAVVTLPLGVLQAPPDAPHAVRFDPPLTAKRAPLAKLAAGCVIKVLLRFRAPFWEEVDGGRYRDAAFFHAPGAVFPTFWTTLPLRTPLLVAWSAGSNAAKLAGADSDALVRAALASLAKLFNGRRLRRTLERAFVHDWQGDPFARGAYSYVVAGGAGARAALARPLEDTLFFAGEAADVGGQSATVAGALASGARAAREVLRERARKSA
ncbi:MAG TPA: NAD(P)/FAD-dependent oxidoreductase [Gammaproteobacteria bacterium]